MTTKEFFDDLLNKIDLKIDDKERSFIETKQNELREKLREYLDLEDDFLTGSYKRSTIIKPKDLADKFDVDLFVAFAKDDYGAKDLAELRDLVTNALTDIKNQYPELGITEISDAQRRSIGVVFGSNFQIDVIPAIEIEKDVLYKIFDKITLAAVESNPKLHGELLTKANEKTGGKLVPLIKMLKSWKGKNCDYMKSFHLELLAVEILGGSDFDSYADGMVVFFDKARDYVKESCMTDPANSQLSIDEYLDSDGTRQKLQEQIEIEYQLSKKAHELQLSGNEAKAVEYWQKVFDNQDGDLDNKFSKPTAFSPRPQWCIDYADKSR